MAFLYKRQYEKSGGIVVVFRQKNLGSTSTRKKGKWTESGKTMRESEGNFSRMLDVVVLSKNQGVSPDPGFLQKMNLSNSKHREVIEELLSTAPQGARAQLEEAIQLNADLRKKLDESF
ncbi:MAG: hypothetical protein UZ22_OP11002001005 [Microgenomates bacterium OLB23]|nr:MAG: hypothetical protein UZ22_OP11002001005 [Microgenomates bacterium OLB23]